MGQYLAFDLGAESGRAIAGKLSGGHLEVDELHRFANTPVRDGDSLYWDTERLWQAACAALRWKPRAGK